MTEKQYINCASYLATSIKHLSLLIVENIYGAFGYKSNKSQVIKRPSNKQTAMWWLIVKIFEKYLFRERKRERDTKWQSNEN